MRRPLIAALFGGLLALSCVPAAVDYSALTSAAEARQRAAGSALAPADKTVRALLSRPLSAEAAAQVALLNNRGVRALVEELGIAQGRLAHDRRLPNPTVGAAMRFEGGGNYELEIDAMIDLTDLVLLPWRSSAGSAEVDAARLSAIGAVLDLSFDTRRAFFEYQGAAEIAHLQRTVLEAFRASAELATRLHEAGNITELDLATQQSALEEARIELQAAELEAAAARERLNAVMGLWGKGVEWRAAERLPDPPDRELAADDLEARAVERSLDLLMTKHRFTAAAERANVAQIEGVLPELKAGVSAERGDEWGVGPAVEIELPIFYQGQGAVGAAKAEMRQQQNLYTDLAVGVRAAARSAASELRARREAVLYYRKTLLPLKQKVVDQSQLEYNAMLIGLPELLVAKRDQVRSAVTYVEQLRDYWIARTNAEQLLAGRLPPGASGSSVAASTVKTAEGNGDDH